MDKHKFWVDETGAMTNFPATLEFRSTLAFDLIRSYGAIAGKRGQIDDPSGHWTLELQTPQELVERCFQIADLFTDTAIERGELRAATSYAERKAAQIEIDGQIYKRNLEKTRRKLEDEKL